MEERNQAMISLSCWTQ